LTATFCVDELMTVIDRNILYSWSDDGQLTATFCIDGVKTAS